jgi:hypothetical protein
LAGLGGAAAGLGAAAVGLTGVAAVGLTGVTEAAGLARVTEADAAEVAGPDVAKGRAVPRYGPGERADVAGLEGMAFCAGGRTGTFTSVLNTFA